jgi:hypothetical protein
MTSKIEAAVRAVADEWGELVDKLDDCAERVSQACFAAEEVLTALDLVQQKRAALEGSAGAELLEPMANAGLDDVTLGRPEWTYWALGVPRLYLRRRDRRGRRR